MTPKQFIEKFTLAMLENESDWAMHASRLIALCPEARDLMDQQRRTIEQLERRIQELEQELTKGETW